MLRIDGIIFASGLMLAAAPAQAEDWYRMAENGQGVFYVDRASVSRAGDVVKAEVLWGDRHEAASLPFSVTIEFGCSARTMRMVSVQAYSLFGTVKQGERQPSADTAPAAAGGVEGQLLDLLCAGRGWAEQVADPVAQLGRERTVSVQGCRQQPNSEWDVCRRRKTP